MDLGDSDSSDFEVINPSDYDELEQPEHETLQKIRDWLQPTQYDAPHSSEFQRHLNSLTLGTGRWIRQSEQYRQWDESSKQGCLWVKGVPGSGKSVLAASFVSELASQNIPVLFFFFRQIIAANRMPVSLLRDWAAQLLPNSPKLQTSLKPLVEANRELASISFATWWQHLGAAMQSFPKIYCVADALDEMDENTSFLQQLVELGELKPKSIKVFLTSRPYPLLENAFRNSGTLSLRLDQQHVDKDIEIYVNKRLTDPIHYELSQNLKAYIAQTICTRSRGLFLYARLMMDAIVTAIQQEKTPDIKVIERAVDTLPMDLDDMYNRMLLEHAQRLSIEQSLQVQILSWVTHSRRPLRLLEMANIVHFLAADSVSFKDRKLQVKNACGPLVEILEDETLQIIHHSFTEFLFDPRVESSKTSTRKFPLITSDDAHRVIAVACVLYLISLDEREADQDAATNPGWFDTNANLQSLGLQQDMHDVFKVYATTYWHNHTAACHDLGQELLDLLDRLLVPTRTIIRQRQVAVFQRPPTKERDKYQRTRFPAPLHAASTLGLTSYAEHLMQSGVDLHAVDDQGNTALHEAARNGHSGVVMLLLKYGANPNPENGTGSKALYDAASCNHAEVVKILLAAGVSPLTAKTIPSLRHRGNMGIDSGATPLRYATQAGHYESTIEMLPYLAPKDLEEALCWSIQSGNEKLSLEILETTTVSANAAYNNITALCLGAEGHSPPIVEALLRHGADRTIKSGYNYGGQTPLHRFAQGHRHGRNHMKVDEKNAAEVFRLLLQAGFDINALDNHNNTPLLSLALKYSGSHCSTFLVKLFLENGANPLATNSFGESPLYALCKACDSQEALEAVIQYGGQINPSLEQFQAIPIFAAMESMGTSSLEVLLKYGVDCTVRLPVTGIAPIHTLLQSGSRDREKRLDMLISAGTDLGMTNKDGDTALHLVEKSGQESRQLILKLLNAGLSLEARNHLGETVLLREIRTEYHGTYGKTEGIRLLIDLGADVNAYDNSGRSVLHTLACSSCPIDRASVFRGILNRGPDLQHRDFRGNTLLHTVLDTYERRARRSSTDYFFVHEEKKFFEMVLALDIDRRAKNYQGQLAIHLAAAQDFPSSEDRWAMFKIDQLDILIRESSLDELNSTDHSGRVPLHYASTTSEYYVGRLLKADVNPDVVDSKGRSPLHYAASARQANNVALLSEFYKMKYPHILDQCDTSGRTALHYAVRSGILESVEALLEAGADVNKQDRQMKSPLFVCTEIDQEEAICDFYRKNKDSLCHKHRDVLRPVDDNRVSDDGNVYHATRAGDIARLLIKHGASLNIARQDNQWVKSFGRTSGDQNRFFWPLGVHEGCASLVRTLRKMVNIGDLQVDHTLSPEPSRAEYRLLLTHEDKRDEIKSFFHHSNVKDRDDYFVGQCKDDLFDEDLVQLLVEVGADLGKSIAKFWRPGQESALTFLARKGLVNSMRHLAKEVELYEKDEHKAELPEQLLHTRQLPQPLLVIACKRETNNIAMVKLLVEFMHVDVNKRCKIRQGDIVCLGSNEGYKIKQEGNAIVEGSSALHTLARGTHWWYLKALGYLLENGADVNAMNEHGETPLHVACRGNEHYTSTSTTPSGFWHNQTVSMLLKHGANVEMLDLEGQSCMSKATNNIDVIKQLVQFGVSMSLGRRQPLFSAIRNQNIDVVRYLLEANADPNAAFQIPAARDHRTADRLTQQALQSLTQQEEKYGLLMEYPLVVAAWTHGYSEEPEKTERRSNAAQLIKLLLDYGADYKLHLRNGCSIIHHIFAGTDYLAYEPFLTYPGINLDLQDSHGVTPLLAAISALNPPHGLADSDEDDCHDYVPLILLNKGVDVTITDHNGSNALHYLLLKQNFHCTPKVLEKFLQHPKFKGLVPCKNNEGYTPIHLALDMDIRRHYSEKKIRMLIDQGADLMEPDPKNHNPLHRLACFLPKNPEMPLWDECLKLGADINAKNSDGETPLFKWVRGMRCTANISDYERSLARLPGANIHVRNNRGENCLHLVAQHDPIIPKRLLRRRQEEKGIGNGIRDLFKMFLEKGVDVAAEDEKQQTPLDVAAMMGHSDILEMFARDK